MILGSDFLEDDHQNGLGVGDAFLEEQTSCVNGGTTILDVEPSDL